MFFHHLKNLSPYSGHICNLLKVAVIRKKDRYIEQKSSRFDLLDMYGYFPFWELINGQRACFISDTDIYDFLSCDERIIENYITDYYQNWNFTEREPL